MATCGGTPAPPPRAYVLLGVPRLSTGRTPGRCSAEFWEHPRPARCRQGVQEPPAPRLRACGLEAPQRGARAALIQAFATWCVGPEVGLLVVQMGESERQVTEQGSHRQEPSNSRASGSHPLMASRTLKNLGRFLVQPHTPCESLSETSGHHHGRPPRLSVTLWPEAATPCVSLRSSAL